MPAAGRQLNPAGLGTSQAPLKFQGWITSTGTIPALTALVHTREAPAVLTAFQSIRIPRDAVNTAELAFVIADPAGADAKTVAAVHVWHEYEVVTDQGPIIEYRYQPGLVLALTGGSGQIPLTSGIRDSKFTPPASIADAGDVTWVDTITKTADYTRGAVVVGELVNGGGASIQWDATGAKAIIVASAVTTGQGLGVFHREI